MTVHDVGHVPIYRKSLIDKYLERYIESNQTDEVTLWRGVATTPTFNLIYQGPARVHRLSSPMQMGFGDEPQYMVTGVISLPMQEAMANGKVRISVNDTAIVEKHWDAAMVGRTYRVVHIDIAGQFHNAVTLSVVGSEEHPSAAVHTLDHRGRYARP